ncbi:MAG: ABC transporter ATP-binding protein [Deltaproteobacteria bacterium]|nr:ABC transporter ATP-binding protein [Deltaproteobacteria bacterium]
MALHEVSFHIKEGSFVGLIGPNGSGKTTMFNVISGALKPTRGEVVFEGETISGFTPNAICHAGIARTFQIPQPITTLTVAENVMLGVLFGRGGKRKFHEESIKKDAIKMLNFVGLDLDPESYPEKMTAGDLRKLEMARALATQPKILLADEVLSGLNKDELKDASAILTKARAEMGVTIIWVEHIMHVLMKLVERVIVLNHGLLIADGDPDSVSNDKQVVEAYLGVE